jgi:hypothetical protein
VLHVVDEAVAHLAEGTTTRAGRWLGARRRCAASSSRTCCAATPTSAG